MKELSLVGATGSIGKQTLNVVDRYPDLFKVKSMVANSSCEEFLSLVKKYRPEYAALVDERAGEKIKDEIPKETKFAYGEQASKDAVSLGDTVVVASGGFSGLKYSFEALKNHKDIALANKETLVCGGDLFMSEYKKSGVKLMPVDSEHSAIWQALDFDYDKPFKNLILTASGGPFYHYTKEQLERVKASDALKHPTWKMGAKITVDSATLLNKGYEVIEAHHLYHAPLEKIKTIVQPESIIHSMVEFDDGAILAQLSYPTMELPIQLALTYPNRLSSSVKPMDFNTLSSIRFLPLEREKFPCYHLALCASEAGGTYPCALNGAGEVAVRAFLKDEIPFTAISSVLEDTLSKTEREDVVSYEQLVLVDERARETATKFIEKNINR